MNSHLTIRIYFFPVTSHLLNLVLLLPTLNLHWMIMSIFGTWSGFTSYHCMTSLTLISTTQGADFAEWTRLNCFSPCPSLVAHQFNHSFIHSWTGIHQSGNLCSLVPCSYPPFSLLLPTLSYTFLSLYSIPKVRGPSCHIHQSPSSLIFSSPSSFSQSHSSLLINMSFLPAS